MANYVNSLIEYFGEQNDELNEEELEALEDEIDALDDFLDDTDIFKLAIFSIRKGKPDILEILLDKIDLDNTDIAKLNKEIQIYGKTIDIKKYPDYGEIILEFENIMKDGKDYSKKPYHKKR